MPTLTLKNIPEPLYNKLKAAARRHHRSVNGEVLHYLETRLEPRPVSPQERLEQIRKIRPEIATDAVTPDELEDAIRDGRP